MSEVIWKKSFLPVMANPAEAFTSEFYGESPVSVLSRRLNFNEREANLPDRRAFRTMSRAAMLLSVLGLEGRDILDPVLKRDPFQVGIYFAVENGPVDSESAFNLREINFENFAVDYKKQRNPTMYLKQLPNLAAAHLGIFLGAFGPASVFTDSEYGSIHALEQAEVDLENGVVELALVGSAFTFENPISVWRNASKDTSKPVCEGAGFMILQKSGSRTDWSAFQLGELENNFGIANQIIELNERGLANANG